MSLFGKMNQTEKAKNDGGIIRKTTMAEQVAEGQQSFISHRATSRTYLHIARYRKWSTPLLQAGCRGFF